MNAILVCSAGYSRWAGGSFTTEIAAVGRTIFDTLTVLAVRGAESITTAIGYTAVFNGTGLNITGFTAASRIARQA